MFFQGPRQSLKSQKAEQCQQRRRRGLTSPPLIGIEENPGPKRKACRRQRKSEETPKTRKKPKLSKEKKDKLVERRQAGETKESIIRSSPYNKNTVELWLQRAEETGSTDRKKRAPKKKDEPPIEAEKPKEAKNSHVTFKQMSDFEKGEVIMARELGASIEWIAQRLDRDHHTVRYWIERWQDKGSCKRLEGSGRPHVTLPGDDRYLKFLSLNDPWLSAAAMVPKVADHAGAAPSVETIRRRLRDFGLYAFKPCSKPLLKAKNIKARLAWAKKHADWTHEQWKRVLWTDESPFQLFNSGRPQVRRRKGERLQPGKTKKTVKHGGGKIQVWGCFHSQGVGYLKLIEGKMDSAMYKQILIHHAMPKLKELIAGETDFVAWVFQQDNDPKHTSKVAKEFLANNVPKAQLLLNEI